MYRVEVENIETLELAIRLAAKFQGAIEFGIVVRIVEIKAEEGNNNE